MLTGLGGARRGDARCGSARLGTAENSVITSGLLLDGQFPSKSYLIHLGEFARRLAKSVPLLSKSGFDAWSHDRLGVNGR